MVLGGVTAGGMKQDIIVLPTLQMRMGSELFSDITCSVDVLYIGRVRPIYDTTDQ